MTVNEISERLWRNDLQTPGYCWMDQGVVDSHELRRRMVAIGDSLPGIVFRSMARFDQQETTKFHQDGGPPFNILMLGYEPSKVKSRLFLADHHACAQDIRVLPTTLVTQAMFGNDQELQPYTTELPPPEEGHSYILMVNNSEWLGLLHKAEIINPTESEPRIVNSIMLSNEAHGHTREQRDEFIATDEISRKTY